MVDTIPLYFPDKFKSQSGMTRQAVMPTFHVAYMFFRTTLYSRLLQPIHCDCNNEVRGSWRLSDRKTWQAFRARKTRPEQEWSNGTEFSSYFDVSEFILGQPREVHPRSGKCLFHFPIFWSNGNPGRRPAARRSYVPSQSCPRAPRVQALTKCFWSPNGKPIEGCLSSSHSIYIHHKGYGWQKKRS